MDILRSRAVGIHEVTDAESPMTYALRSKDAEYSGTAETLPRVASLVPTSYAEGRKLWAEPSLFQAMRLAPLHRMIFGNETEGLGLFPPSVPPLPGWGWKRSLVSGGRF